MNRGETDDCSDVNSDERPEVDRSTLSQELVPMYDCVVELTELLENYNGDLGQAGCLTGPGSWWANIC